jgi:hypothetical protein
MFSRFFLPILLVLLAGSLFITPGAQQTERPSLETEESAVHAVMVVVILSRVSANVVELDNETLIDAGGARHLILDEGRDLMDALADYMGKNGKSFRIGQEPTGRYRLLRPDRYKSVTPCPCLRVAFSRVGFNRRKDTALVRVRYELTSSKSVDQYVVLRKRGDGWEVEKRVPRFVRLQSR